MKKWVFLFFFCWVLIGCMRTQKVVNFVGKDKSEIEKFASNFNLNLNIEEIYSEKKVGTILKQQPSSGVLNKNEEIKVIISKGIDYESYHVNELGNVPIMMYHGIWNMLDEETHYKGGNVDKDGYQRTTESFIRDLEFYYKEGYRMIRLADYVEGKIEVEVGKSPIILTFDDGKHNIDVTKDEFGELVIDPNCAVGILEAMKEKYPDYHVTATFFLNETLFQSEWNEEIINWLIDHGYDIGNHSISHPDFSKITKEEASKQIGQLYFLLDSIIPKKYVSIVALPFGSPYKKEHVNFPYILNSSYQEKDYYTSAVLRVGWEANVSPFSKSFDPTFLKRIRAYDCDGKEFDIQMNFKLLEKNRFISDGNVSMITVPKNLENELKQTNLKVNIY